VPPARPRSCSCFCQRLALWRPTPTGQPPSPFVPRMTPTGRGGGRVYRSRLSTASKGPGSLGAPRGWGSDPGRSSPPPGDKSARVQVRPGTPFRMVIGRQARSAFRARPPHSPGVGQPPDPLSARAPKGPLPPPSPATLCPKAGGTARGLARSTSLDHPERKVPTFGLAVPREATALRLPHPSSATPGTGVKPEGPIEEAKPDSRQRGVDTGGRTWHHAKPGRTESISRITTCHPGNGQACDEGSPVASARQPSQSRQP
jgi:hypothetical protein